MPVGDRAVKEEYVENFEYKDHFVECNYFNYSNNIITMNDIQTYITGWIDSLQLERVKVHSVKQQVGGYYIITIYGGLNGCGSWNLYIRQIGMIVDSLRDSWVIEINNDRLDDLWTLQLGFEIKNIKE